MHEAYWDDDELSEEEHDRTVARGRLEYCVAQTWHNELLDKDATVPDEVSKKLQENEKYFWGGVEETKSHTMINGTMFLQYGWCMPRNHQMTLSGVRAALGAYPGVKMTSA